MNANVKCKCINKTPYEKKRTPKSTHQDQALESSISYILNLSVQHMTHILNLILIWNFALYNCLNHKSQKTPCMTVWQVFARKCVKKFCFVICKKLPFLSLIALLLHKLIVETQDIGCGQWGKKVSWNFNLIKAVYQQFFHNLENKKY